MIGPLRRGGLSPLTEVYQRTVTIYLRKSPISMRHHRWRLFRLSYALLPSLFLIYTKLSFIWLPSSLFWCLLLNKNEWQTTLCFRLLFRFIQVLFRPVSALVHNQTFSPKKCKSRYHKGICFYIDKKVRRENSSRRYDKPSSNAVENARNAFHSFLSLVNRIIAENIPEGNDLSSPGYARNYPVFIFSSVMAKF